MKRKLEPDENPRKKKADYHSSYGDGGSWLRVRNIGKGTFGSVYLAELRNPRRRYSYLPPVMAVKSADVSVSASLQNERMVLSDLQESDYVLGCYGEEITTSDQGEMIFNLLLEYASGGDLASLIKKSNGRGLSEYDVQCYTRSILKGLKHVHDCGYVHCDLKPENILLVSSSSTEKFVAKIGDFGLAKRKNKMLNQYLRGTPLYMAPEVVVDGVQEPPSDVWALGCVVFEMFSGKPMWDRKHVSDECGDLLCRIANEDESPNIPEGIPEEAKSFLKCCLGRKPYKRWTAEELLDHPFLAGLDDDLVSPVTSDDELPCQIAFEDKRPVIPDEIHEDAKSFLKGCFERHPMQGSSAEQPLNHPFLAVINEEIDIAVVDPEIPSDGDVEHEESDLQASDLSNPSGETCRLRESEIMILAFG